MCLEYFKIFDYIGFYCGWYEVDGFCEHLGLKNLKYYFKNNSISTE